MIAIKDMEMPRVCYECPVKQNCQTGIYDGWRIDKRADDCPLVEIEERKAGEWEDMHDKEEWYGDQFKCSVCGWVTLDNGKYCPNCGAEMRGAENGSN